MQTLKFEFHSYSIVRHLNKKLSKLLLWWCSVWEVKTTFFVLVVNRAIIGVNMRCLRACIWLYNDLLHHLCLLCLLCFWYPMDSSNKDVTFDYNPLRELVAKPLQFYPIVPIQLVGHTSADYGFNGADLVRCVTSLVTVVSRGCLVRVPGMSSICVKQPRLTYSSSFRRPSL